MAPERWSMRISPHVSAAYVSRTLIFRHPRGKVEPARSIFKVPLIRIPHPPPFSSRLLLSLRPVSRAHSCRVSRLVIHRHFRVRSHIELVASLATCVRVSVHVCERSIPCMRSGEVPLASCILPTRPAGWYILELIVLVTTLNGILNIRYKMCDNIQEMISFQVKPTHYTWLKRIC